MGFRMQGSLDTSTLVLDRSHEAMWLVRVEKGAHGEAGIKTVDLDS